MTPTPRGPSCRTGPAARRGEVRAMRGGLGVLQLAVVLLLLSTLVSGGCGIRVPGKVPAAPEPPGISTADLAARRAAGDSLVLLDVRTPGEYAEGHIPGAVLAPLYGLDRAVDRLAAAGDRDRPVVVYCEAGVRSDYAARALESRGFTRVLHYHAGMAAWRRSGPVARGMDRGPG